MTTSERGLCQRVTADNDISSRNTPPNIMYFTLSRVIPLLRALVLLLCAFFLGPLFAASSYTPKIVDPMYEPWRWQHIKKLDGLGVISMAQARDGSIWFGLAEGIAHYDGLHWQHYKSVAESRISAVMALLSTRDGAIYARTGNGILKYQNHTWSVLLNEQLRRVEATLVESADGSVWSLEKTGLVQIKSGQVIKHSINDVAFDDIFVDAKQNLWAVERVTGNIYKYPIRDGKLQTGDHDIIKAPEKYALGYSTYRVALHDDCVWLTDRRYNNSLRCYNLKSKQWQEFNLQNMGGTNRHYGIKVDRHGALWVWGSYAINLYKNGKWTIYRSPEFNIPDDTYQLIHTNDDSIWFGGSHTIVTQVNLSRERWGQSYEGIHYYCETSLGVRWFLDVSGKIVANLPEDDSWIAFTPSETGINEPAMISVSSDDTIWLAGSHDNTAAIAHYDGTTWRRNLHPKFARTISHLAGTEIANGQILFGAFTFSALSSGKNHQGGIIAYAKTDGRYHFEWLAPPQGPQRAASIAQSQDRSLWATNGNYLLVGKNNQFENILTRSNIELNPNMDGMRRGRNKHVVTAKDGRIWVANARMGIFSFDGESWQRYTTADGLPSNLTSYLLPLYNNSLLAVTNLGISRFDGQTWNPFLRELTSVLPEVHTLKLASDDGIWINFAKQDWYLGSSKSLEVKQQSFKTLHYRFDHKAPDTRIEVYNNEVPHSGFNHIFWSGTDAWVQDSDKFLQYAYRLDDGAWSLFKNEQRQLFGDLAPGHHTLAVRARDPDFNIDPTPAQIDFYVVPPLWRQTWFQIATLLVIATVTFFIVLIIRIREKHIIEMEEMKISFFTNVSHELRTPLMLILGPLEKLLNERRFDENTLSLMQRNANRLLRLVNQLLDFRQAQTTHLQLQKSEADIVTYVREIAESIRPLAAEKHVVYNYELPIQPHHVRFDADKLEKILNNLITNAIKYTPQGGTVFLQLSILNKVEQADQQYLAKFIIEDSGIGVDKKHIEHIFDPFYRVDNPNTKVLGSGVGLALTKELVDSCGGTIEIVSPIKHGVQASTGGGSRITLHLPVDKPDTDPQVDPATPASSQLDNPTAPTQADHQESKVPPESCVLIVEDDPDVQRFITDQIQNNHQAITANNGEQGLLKAREIMPDLIITDVMMPVMDGIELCKRLKTDELTSHIPVIMLTARASQEAELTGLETGADDYITKPFAMPILEARMNNLLQSRRKLREQFGKSLPLQTNSVTTNITDEKFLHRAKTIVENNMVNHDYGVNEFANDMNMKYKTLYVKIKALTDQSLQGFIRAVRLEKSIKLLQEGNHTIQEVSSQVGFDDPNYFSRCFKQQFGFAPSETHKLK